MKFFLMASTLLFMSPICAMDVLQLTEDEKAALPKLAAMNDPSARALLIMQLQRLMGSLKKPQDPTLLSRSSSSLKPPLTTDASTMTERVYPASTPHEILNTNSPAPPDVSLSQLFLEKTAPLCQQASLQGGNWIAWAKNNRKKTAGLAAICCGILSNMHVAWRRYQLESLPQWSQWSTPDDQQDKALLEALYHRYQPLHEEDNFYQLKAHFIHDTNNELKRLRAYTLAAYCPSLLTSFIQQILNKIKEGCIGFCGNGILARRLWGFVFGMVRPDSILFGDAALIKDTNKRITHIGELRALLYTILVQEQLHAARAAP